MFRHQKLAFALFALFATNRIALTQENVSTAAGVLQEEKLPQPITNSSLADVFKRFDASVPLALDTIDGYHQHTDVRIVDIYGRTTDATVDRWQLGEWVRIEEHASGWTRTILRNKNQQWTTREGSWSLRLRDLERIAPRPVAIEELIQDTHQGRVGLRAKTVEGRAESCAERFTLGVCFDKTTGFLIATAFDGEDVQYLAWSRYKNVYYPSHITRSQQGRVQLDATVKTFKLLEPGTRFDPLPGVIPVAISALDRTVYQDVHKVIRGGYLPPNAYNRFGNKAQLRIFGEAEVKVSVDKEGRVTDANVIDADNKPLEGFLLDASKSAVYETFIKGGHAEAFETILQFDLHAPQYTVINPSGSYNTY